MARDIKLVYWNADDEAELAFLQNSTITIGKDNLIQYIIKKILSMKGSNGFELTIGSNFLHLPGGIYSGSADAAFKTNLILAMKDLETEIKSVQTASETSGDVLSDAEKLKIIKLRSSKFVIATGRWKIKLDVYTEDDDVLSISLPI